MEPINGLERLTRLLRQKATDKAPAHNKSTGTGKPPAGHAARASVAELEKQIQKKISVLAQAGASPAALTRTLIESTLCWEFDRDLRNEPKFAALVGRVQDHIADDSELRQMCDTVIKQLRI